jgi:hypothetical protein
MDIQQEERHETHETPCPTWIKTEKQLELCKVGIMKNRKTQYVVVNGVLNDELYGLSLKNKLFVKYWAAQSPTYNGSFSGSGLPFANEEMAFQGTKNYGVVPVEKGKFSLSVHYPNSYYKEGVLISPQIKIKVCNHENIAVSPIQQIHVGGSIPFRRLSYEPNRCVMFYKNENLPVRNQEQILLDSAYPRQNKIPSNFWGVTPAL